MDCRTTLSHRFRTRLGFKQYYVILTKEQSMLTRIMNSFEEENMQTQSNVLANKIDSYFHDYKLAIKINKKETATEVLTKTKTNRTRTWL